MNQDFSVLRAPSTGERLVLVEDVLYSGDGSSYPIVNGIPRFVESTNYSAGFGLQWKHYPKTQLDSYSRLDISEARLARCLRNPLSKLKGKIVLEAGSGAGRFTEILLKYGAIVHSFDYSSAVEVNFENNGYSSDLLLVQADIRKMPFQKQTYDYVICLGVLQHTPSPEESISHLWDMVAPGGALVIDHYPWRLRLVLPPPFGEAISIYRAFILRLPQHIRYTVVNAITRFWFPIHWGFRDSLFAQRILRRLSPVIFYYPELALGDKQTYFEWSLLDTHDATTDYYKHRRTMRQLRKKLEELMAIDICVRRGGIGIEAFCRKDTGRYKS